MAIKTIEDVRRAATKRGWPSLESAARHAQSTAGVYLDPEACRKYEAQRGQLSTFMRAAWTFFFAHHDLEFAA